MTIGEKIKYLRNLRNLTQNQLAEMTGIHLVTIAKYETNKTKPQPAQIKRLVSALSVNLYALLDLDFNNEIQSRTDFTALLVQFLKNEILNICGERDEDGQLNTETVSFYIAPVLANFFNLTTNNQVRFEDVILSLKDEQILSKILSWEKLNYLYVKAKVKYRDTEDEEVLRVVNELKNNMELIEFELLLMD